MHCANVYIVFFIEISNGKKFELKWRMDETEIDSQWRPLKTEKIKSINLVASLLLDAVVFTNDDGIVALHLPIDC